MQPVTSDPSATAACALFIANIVPGTPGTGLTVPVKVLPTLKGIPGVGATGAWASNSSLYQLSSRTVLIDDSIFSTYRVDLQVGVLAHELGHAYSHHQGGTSAHYLATSMTPVGAEEAYADRMACLWGFHSELRAMRVAAGAHAEYLAALSQWNNEPLYLKEIARYHLRKAAGIVP